jgi:hypothetical protein
MLKIPPFDRLRVVSEVEPPEAGERGTEGGVETTIFLPYSTNEFTIFCVSYMVVTQYIVIFLRKIAFFT